MANLAIKGHATRSKEVIEILEMLGGTNSESCWGVFVNRLYSINAFGVIEDKSLRDNSNYQVYTLEEFLKKFPYKIGERVRIPEYESEVCISKMYWDGNEVQYEVVTDEVEWYSAKELNEFNEPNKEETIEKANKAVFDANAQCCDIMNHLIKEKTMEYIKIDIPKGYEFAGVDDDKQQVVFEKVKSKYPKTYRECAEIVGFNIDEEPTIFGYKEELLDRFQKLLICRDAYWKMGLDKPWKPDFTNDKPKYCLYVDENVIECDMVVGINTILSFPTEEMRDAFYENFKDLIEQCKELL